MAPDLLLAELGNVFLKKVRLGEMQASVVPRSVSTLHDAVTMMPMTGLFEAAFEIASDHNRSFHDALYVALALDQHCPLITADERLVNALRPRFGDMVVWLGDLPAA
jgi:predicted nucleic acid-binding protein